MTALTHSDKKQGMVQKMRDIRDQISLEIQDMTFEQQRAYLDRLLSKKKETNAQQGLGASGVNVKG